MDGLPSKDECVRMASVLKKYGFRSILGDTYQSWSGFTGTLFSHEVQRNEFDLIEFKFEHEKGEEYRHRFTFGKTEECMTAGYFGRPMEDVKVMVTSKQNYSFDEKVEIISLLLPQIYNHLKVDTLSTPIFVVDKVTEREIGGYYLWEYWEG